MTNLRTLHRLLRQEYAASRHIWWFDDRTGQCVNDVTHTLRLIHRTADAIRRGDLSPAWYDLAAYALDRAMSPHLMQAIGSYLSARGWMPPIPLIDLTADEPPAIGEISLLPLEEETDRFLSAPVERPEPDRDIALRRDHGWTRPRPRLRDTHPAPQTQTVSKSVHWFFV